MYLCWFGVDHIAEVRTRELLLQAIGQGGLAGVILMLTYSRTVMLLGAARAALFPSLIPALAILIGVPLIGEVPDTVQLAELTLVTIGLLVAIDVLRWR